MVLEDPLGTLVAVQGMVPIPVHLHLTAQVQCSILVDCDAHAVLHGHDGAWVGNVVPQGGLGTTLCPTLTLDRLSAPRLTCFLM